MAANKSDIREWLDEAVRIKAKYLIVVCDTFDYDDYPIYASSDVEVVEQYKHYQGHNMQRVMEVYDLSLDVDQQLREHRAWHLPGQR